MGAPFDSREYVVCFWQIQPERGGAVHFQPIQPVGGAHVCILLLQGGTPFSPEEGGP